MKKLSVHISSTMAWLMVFIMPCFALQGADEDAKAILTDWEQAIKRAPEGFDPKYVSMLGQALRKLSGPGPTYQEIRHRLFLEAQQKMLSTPGHAQYFANKLEQIRESNPKTGHDFERMLYIAETLIHMPSPETIKVLGNYLYDERDTPPQRNCTPENAHLAAYALSRIALRDFPFEGPLVPYSLAIWPDLKQLPDYRSWWEEVKAGKRTFSFKGQAVEYRFKPDGTWDTIPIANPPDDGPKPAAAPTTYSPTKKPEAAREHSLEPPRNTTWWWYVVSVFAVLVLGAWFLWKKTT